MATNVSHRETFESGAYIVREDTPSLAAYVIETGEVEVLKDHHGKKVIVGTLTKGDIFGEMGILGRMPHTASVRAKTNVKLGVINNRSMLAEMEKMPEDHRVFILALIKRLTATTENMARLTVQIHRLKAYADTLAEQIQADDSENTDSR